jgi:hypothetical protein
MAEQPPLREQLRLVARYGLVSDESGAPPARIQQDLWRSFIDSLVAHKITGLAMASLDAGRLELSEDQADELRARHREAMLVALILEQRLLRIVESLEKAAVRAAVIKGPALAHCFYPDASWRSFGDLDLLVRTRDWSQACAALNELGFRRRLPEPRPGFDERFGKGALHVDEEGLQVDLHRTLMAGPFGIWIDHDELFSRAVTFGLAGRPLYRLDDASVLVHACMHAVLGGRMSPRLYSLRDVAQACTSRVEWPLVADWVQRWNLGAVVRAALLVATRELGFDLSPEAAAMVARDPSSKERRALEAYTPRSRAGGGMVVSTLVALPGVRARMSYLRILLLPGQSFLKARSAGGRPSYLRRLMVPLTWLRRRTNR